MMPYSNRCRSANLLMLSVFGVLWAFAAAIAGGLQETAQTLAQAKTSADEEIRPKLESLSKKVSALATEAQAIKPGVTGRLNEVIKEVDALLNR